MRALLLVVAGCGRVGFEPALDAGEPEVVYALDTAAAGGRVTASDPADDGFCQPAACPLGVAGIHGGAAHFSGAQGVHLGIPALAGAPPYTVAAWFRRTGGGDGTLVAKPIDAASYDDAFSLWVRADGTVVFETAFASRAADYLSGGLVDDGWHHAAASYDGQTKRLYVDGILSGAEATTDCLDAAGPLYLGTDLDVAAPINALVGDLDDVHFVPRVLSDPEIAALATP